MIPERLLPHAVVIVAPALSSDAYNNVVYDYGPGAGRTAIMGRVYQNRRAERYTDGRSAAEELWALFVNHAAVAEVDRIEWTTAAGPVITFEVFGPPKPTYQMSTFHHLEADLRILEG